MKIKIFILAIVAVMIQAIACAQYNTYQQQQYPIGRQSFGGDGVPTATFQGAFNGFGTGAALGHLLGKDDKSTIIGGLASSALGGFLGYNSQSSANAQRYQGQQYQQQYQTQQYYPQQYTQYYQQQYPQQYPVVQQPYQYSQVYPQYQQRPVSQYDLRQTILQTLNQDKAKDYNVEFYNDAMANRASSMADQPVGWQKRFASNQQSKNMAIPFGFITPTGVKSPWSESIVPCPAGTETLYDPITGNAFKVPKTN